jgi:Cu+-exporting ATPase
MSAVDVEFDIGGMTCASCATRIERKLNRLDGVDASVNYATEKARVRADHEVDTTTLIATIEAAGYTAQVPPPPHSTTVGTAPLDEAAALAHRLIVSAALAAPVVVLSMIPALQFANWQWLALMLAAPVAVWGAWPFHRAAWITARHGATGLSPHSAGRCTRCFSARRA